MTVRVSEIRDLAVLPVFHSSPDVIDVCDVLGIRRDLAYRMIRDGDLPAIKLGRRTVVPVAPLLKLLGADQ